ncbi:MAG: hypothetical protein AM326_04380 [Candidatus Thorarchaeota archaeon SMTZ-45]|nr:MAG: hypothetical protein AM326_04380 [Candidatus Thorarchaeota archaeon SMTZ-45]
MRKITVIMMLIFVVTFFIVCDATKVDASFTPAQGNPQESGELLPDPYLLTEPEIEIGYDSPEFSYDYLAQGEHGEVTLIWEHSAGHQPYFWSIPYVGYVECREFARLKQEFTWEYNQTPVTLRISASVQITCSGDFTLQDNGDEMYAIYFWIGPPGYSYAGRIKTVTGLKGGQTYDIQFLLTSSEAKQYFVGSIEEEGFQIYPHDNYAMFMGLIPTERFVAYYGGSTPFDVYEGVVNATISHFSIEALLKVDDLTPELISPKFNTTISGSIYNGITRLEPLGENSFVHLSFDYFFSQEVTLGCMTSNHTSIWNVTPYQEVSTYGLYIIVKVVGDGIFLCSPQSSPESVNLFLLKLDSNGQEIWNSSIHLYDMEIPLFMDVDASGTIYILSLSIKYFNPGVVNSSRIVYSLIKLDSMGYKLWDRTLLNLSYFEYVFSVYSVKYPKGLGCYNGEVYIGMPDSVQRYDANGNEVWSIEEEYEAFAPDPFGGFYTCSYVFDEEFRLSRWTTEGTISWTKSFSIDYGYDWQDFPRLDRFEVGHDQLLYLVLEYRHVNHVMTINRVTRSGQIYSQDSIFNLNDTEAYGPYYLKPLVADVAVTRDGLVHLAVMNESTYLYPVMDPFYVLPANILLTFEPSGPTFFTVSPEAMIITGVATLMFAGIAWDHFARGRTRPEEILPQQEEIDPWKLLMEERED